MAPAAGFKRISFAGQLAEGLLVTTTAAVLPAQALRRLPAAHLLAEE